MYNAFCLPADVFCFPSPQKMTCFQKHQAMTLTQLEEAANKNPIPIHRPVTCVHHPDTQVSLACVSCKVSLLPGGPVSPVWLVVSLVSGLHLLKGQFSSWPMSPARSVFFPVSLACASSRSAVSLAYVFCMVNCLPSLSGMCLPGLCLLHGQLSPQSLWHVSPARSVVSPVFRPFSCKASCLPCLPGLCLLPGQLSPSHPDTLVSLYPGLAHSGSAVVTLSTEHWLFCACRHSNLILAGFCTRLPF